jgi:rRNA-processing protein FCF1
MVRAVVLDANALMMPFQFRLNLDRELERLLGQVSVLVPSSVVAELSGLDERDAKAALALAGKYEVVETASRGDDAVLEVAVGRDAALVTNDRELISRAKAQGVPVIRLRSNRYLVMHGDEVD